MSTPIVPTQSARILLDYLTATALRDLADELWDAHLWMYGDLLPLLASPITGYDTDRVRMCVAAAGGGARPDGIALAVHGERGVRVYAHGRLDLLAGLVERAAEELGAPAEISTIDEEAARSLGRRFLAGHRAEPALAATRKLWTRSPAPDAPSLPARDARELGPADAGLFDAVLFPDGTRGWPGFRACLESGLRYFGAFSGDRLVSVAGLCALSRARSEIIGVGTFLESDRRQGYATAACRLALRAALEQARVCSWTADLSNTASLRTAEKLGMRAYLTRYDATADRAGAASGAMPVRRTGGPPASSSPASRG